MPTQTPAGVEPVLFALTAPPAGHIFGSTRDAFGVPPVKATHHGVTLSAQVDLSETQSI